MILVTLRIKSGLTGRSDDVKKCGEDAAPATVAQVGVAISSGDHLFPALRGAVSDHLVSFRDELKYAPSFKSLSGRTI
jgi:hypothetical protein